MVEHGRSKNGVASLAYARPSTVFAPGSKTWMPAFVGMTAGQNIDFPAATPQALGGRKPPGF